MKKRLTVFAALILVALAVPRSALAYDFSAVAPSGQTLYYNIVGGAVLRFNCFFQRCSVPFQGCRWGGGRRGGRG